MPQLELLFDAESHSADAIQRAGYKFADRFAIELRRDSTEFCCRVFPIGEIDDSVIADFRNEVLDQVLRERIRNETADVRNLILALAFSKAGLNEAIEVEGASGEGAMAVLDPDRALESPAPAGD